MSVSMIKKYIVYDPNKLKDFYSTEFKGKIDDIITTYMSNVNNTKINIKNKNIHTKRMVGDYMIPLCYLIYSYIYQNYFIRQQMKDIYIENKLNYKMYQYFFSHKNPMIKKVNVFFYKIFNTDNHEEPNENNKFNKNSNGDIILPEYWNQYVIPEIRKGNTKDNLIAFLNDLDSKIKNDDDKNYDDVIKNLEKLKRKTEAYYKYFEDLQTKYNEDLETAKKDLNEKKLKYNNEKKDETDKLNHKITKKNDDINNIESQINTLKAEIKNIENDLNIKQQDIVKKKEEKSSTKENLVKEKSVISTKISELKQTKEELTKETTRLESKKKSINKSKTPEYEQKINKIEDEIKELDKEVKKLTTEKNSLPNKITELSKSIQNEKYLSKNTENLKSIENNIKTKKEQLNQYKKILIKHRKDLNALNNELNNLLIQYQNAEKKVNILTKDINVINNLVPLFKDQPINKPIEDFIKIFSNFKFKNEYDTIILKYKELLNILKIINKNLLKLNEEQISLNDNKLDISMIDNFKNIYNDKQNVQNIFKEIYKTITDNNKEINSSIDNEKELIKLLFNSLLKKNKEAYINELLDNKIIIINKICNIISNLTSSKTLKNNYKIENINTLNIKINLDDLSKTKFKILYYIYLSIIYEEIKEYNYIAKITENPSLNIEENIKYLRSEYEKLYRIYRKEDNQTYNENKTKQLNLKTDFNKEKGYIQEEINSIDEFLTEKNYNSKLTQKTSELKLSANSFKNKKDKQKYAKDLLNDLFIKNGNQSSYKTSALLKIKDTELKTEIDSLIGQFIRNQTSKKTVTNKSGVKSEKNILPNNNIVKNKIYELLEDYYRKNKNLNLISDEAKISKQEEEKNNLSLLKYMEDKKKELYTLYSNIYSEYLSEIDTIMSESDTAKNNSDENKRDMNILISTHFDRCINLFKIINKMIEKYDEDRTKNKINHYLNYDNISNLIIFDKNEFDKNVNNIYNKKYKSKNIENIENIKNYKTKLKLNSLNSNIKKFKKYIEFLKISNLIISCNQYFTGQKFYFIKKINEINESLKEDNEVKPFFNEYLDHSEKLSLKIIDILRKINEDEIELNYDKIISIDEYFILFEKKIKTINKINLFSERNTIYNGNITKILSYTDSMFLYIIYLTIIIDYLTFFYQS